LSSVTSGFAVVARLEASFVVDVGT
jgi:hypothetical protein